MKYREAIKGARKFARIYKMNYVVVEYLLKHWWSRRQYDYYPACTFESHPYKGDKLLIITPDGTIAQ